MHVGWRYYDPSSGRFLQRDPIGLWGGRNVYEYVRSSPLSWIDPEGTTVAAALPIAGAAAVADGPLPIGDAIGCAIILGAAAYAAYDWFFGEEEAPPDSKEGDKEHKKNKRKSTKEKHEEGQARKKKDQGGEKGDKRRPHRRK